MTSQERRPGRNEQLLLPTDDTFIKLWKLRDVYHDEIPDRDVNSALEDNRWKIRKGWFQTLAGVLDNGINFYKDIIDEEVVNEVKEFCTWVTSPEIKTYRKMTREDVNKGNAIINRVLTKYRPEYAITRYQDYTIYKQT